MRNHWLVLQHVEWEGLGIIAREAKNRGLEMEVRRLDRDDEIPEAEHIDGLVVMGGPFGAYEEERYSFLVQECNLLAAVARRGKPVLGVCLGAQLLAKALGAKVFPGHGTEVGFGTVALTAAAREDALFAGIGSVLPAFHWHGDTFTLPEGAVLLASSSMYEQQAFRFGELAYGFQFHIEPDADTWAAWRDHLPKGLILGSETQRQQIMDAGNRVIARFFELAANSVETEMR